MESVLLNDMPLTVVNPQSDSEMNINEMKYQSASSADVYIWYMINDI